MRCSGEKLRGEERLGVSWPRESREESKSAERTGETQCGQPADGLDTALGAAARGGHGPRARERQSQVRET